MSGGEEVQDGEAGRYSGCGPLIVSLRMWGHETAHPVDRGFRVSAFHAARQHRFYHDQCPVQAMTRRYLAMRFPLHPLEPDGEVLEYPSPTSSPPSITVHVGERQPVATGLYDASGMQLYAVDEPDAPMFVRFRDPA